MDIQQASIITGVSLTTFTRGRHCQALQRSVTGSSNTVSEKALCNDRRVCLSHIRSQILSEIGVKSGSQSKNMTSDFAPEVAKYPKSILPQQQFRECVSILSCTVSDAASFTCCV